MSDEAVKQVRELITLGKDDAPVTREGGPTQIKLGDWYWIELEDWRDSKKVKERALGCVTSFGSNYIELTFVNGSDMRIHESEFDQECTHEPDAAAIIQSKIEQKRQRTYELMEEVKDVTARLALDAAAPSNETAAITLSSGTQPVTEYKAALVLAKDKTLPDLFKEIKATNESMALWMKAELLPLEAQVAKLKPQMARIEARIFNVELYAGLVETVTQIAEGDAAPPDTPVHLFQRRAYMDEECLADYRAGGMEYSDLRQFDRWLLEPQNLSRLLPHPRCILAMQVRRHVKQRDVDLRTYIRMAFEGIEDLDKLTFLYIRNGQQVFRLSTQIDFGDPLFPDIGHDSYEGDIYADVWSNGDVKGIMSAGHYEERCREYEREREAHAQRQREWQAEVAAARAAGVPEDEWPSKPWGGYIRDDHQRYKPANLDSVYYDDVMAYIAKEVEAHNRLVLVLQGLFDRSPVLHPHPPYQLWNPEHFARALTLIYDYSRALVAGEAPDFEDYRMRLNASLRPGSVTVGQEDVWEEREAERENARQQRDWRIRDKSKYIRFRPSGNPGPGTLAKVVRLRGGMATYEWKRERVRSRWLTDPNDIINDRIQVPTAKVLNVDAYTPGDFRIFFADPRTRQDYLQWAPFLLEAEEWHAGNRKLGDSAGRHNVRESWY